MNTPSRLWYIDNLRIFLISLVVLHHLSITYGAPGDWYYNETEAGFPEIIPMLMFVLTNQSFFMGMFFFVSAFFILPSLKRKGTGRFLKDRLIRLGIPLLLFYFILSPLTVFLLNRFIQDNEVSLVDFWINQKGTGFGPLWFVEALLLFTLIFLLVKPLKVNRKIPFPGTFTILLAAIITGFLQYVIRIWLPVGWSMPFTNFQFPFFLQYIFLFVLGIVAYKNNWLDSITFKTGRNWFLFAQFILFIVFPSIFILGGSFEEADLFMGRGTWQSAGYAILEQVLGFSLIFGLLGMAKKFVNRQGNFARQLSDSAYGVFVFHAPVIVAISIAFAGWQNSPLMKFIVLAPLALTACFVLAWLIKKIPGVRKIF
ncbi:acyltransferase family protein [Mariniphaga sp.]|uniref:acyltransferase family protein n=1 Tax=Mariniphaga sp. TaxID=1954475 RepID=UPI003568FA62